MRREILMNPLYEDFRKNAPNYKIKNMMPKVAKLTNKKKKKKKLPDVKKLIDAKMSKATLPMKLIKKQLENSNSATKQAENVVNGVPELKKQSLIAQKKQLENEIVRLEKSSLKNNEKQIEKLKKKDTLGYINFDSVIIADFDESFKSVATSLLYTDVSSKRISYITLNQWFDESLLKETALQPIFFPSINKQNYEEFKKEYINVYETIPNQLSFLSYDLIGLVYFLLYEKNFETTKNLFLKKNTFRGKIGVFEINENIITHQLNFYSIDDGKFKKIF